MSQNDFDAEDAIWLVARSFDENKLFRINSETFEVSGSLAIDFNRDD